MWKRFRKDWDAYSRASRRDDEDSQRPTLKAPSSLGHTKTLSSRTSTYSRFSSESRTTSQMDDMSGGLSHHGKWFGRSDPREKIYSHNTPRTSFISISSESRLFLYFQQSLGMWYYLYTFL